MSETVSSVYNRFINNLQAVKSCFPLVSTLSCVCGSALITAEGCDVDVISFRELLKHTKRCRSASGHSSLVIPQITSQIYTASDSFVALKNLDSVYSRLQKYYPSSAWTAYGAMIISRMSVPQYSQYLCERTYAIYSRQKAIHPFITDRRDIPLCALMALSDLSDEVMVAAVERYMALLSKLHLGSEAEQSLCHILSVSHTAPENVAEKVILLIEKLRQNKISLGKCSSVIGPVILADIDTDLFVQNIIDADNMLSSGHFFGFFSSASGKHRRMFAVLIALISSVSDATDPVVKNSVRTAAFCCLANGPALYND